MGQGLVLQAKVPAKGAHISWRGPFKDAARV